MKKVITNNELREKINIAINLLCGTVKTTLGPKGNNIIIDHSTFSPFITNDGVTIAKNIESDDEAINTILELAKEASINTNETVGDGTTTTLVLLEAIYNEGIKLINNGLNPMVLKKQIDETVIKIENMILEKSHIPNKKELENIAIISSNSNEVGKIISDTYFKVNNAITITEGKEKTKVNFLEGYIFENNIVSDYYFKDVNEISLENSKILLINTFLDNINYISEIINFIINNNNNLIIIANEYSENFINEVLSLYINENIKIYLFKNPEYGKNQYTLLKNISAITDSKIIENIDYILTDSLGNIEKCSIKKDCVTLNFKKNKYLSKRINEIKKEIDVDNIDFIDKQLAMLTNGLATIEVGAQTIIEKRELKMRYDDALCAIKSASKGVLPGSGLILLEISEKLDNSCDINKLFKNVLSTPFNQILYNSGADYEYIYNKIKKSNYKLLYNINNDIFESINDTLVLDSTEVVINSLKNACSIASMLLTTSSLIINEYQNNFNKINTYESL